MESIQFSANVIHLHGLNWHQLHECLLEIETEHPDWFHTDSFLELCELKTEIEIFLTRTDSTVTVVKYWLSYKINFF